MRLVHISDLHFGAHTPGLADPLREAITQCEPDLVVVSGDLTQRAQKAEFEVAREFLDSIHFPQLIVPGNHDLQGTWRFWERFVKPWANYRKLLHPELESKWLGAGATVIGLNSARPAGWYKDWSRGRLSRRQMAQLAISFAGSPDDSLRVLVVHHPPAAPPGGTVRHLIGRLQEFSEAVNRAGVDLVLSGHFHMSYAQTLPLQGQGHPRSCVLSSVSTATSHRLKGEPNGFHMVTGDATTLRVEDWTWNGQSYLQRRTWDFHSQAGQRDWRTR